MNVGRGVGIAVQRSWRSTSFLSFRSPGKLNPRPSPFRVSLTSVEVPCGKRKGCLPVITLIFSRHFQSFGYRPVWACSAAKPELDSVFGVFDLRAQRHSRLVP